MATIQRCRQGHCAPGVRSKGGQEREEGTEEEKRMEKKLTWI